MNLNEVKIQTSAGTYYIDLGDLEYTARKAIEAAYEEGQDDHNCDYEGDDWECDKDHDGIPMDRIEDTIDDLKFQIMHGGTLADRSASEVLEELLRALRPY